MMKHLLLILLLMTTTHVVACAPSSQFPNISKDLAEREMEIQRDIFITELQKDFDKLQRVAYPIFLKNADICPENKLKPYYGFFPDTTNLYPKEYREAVGRVLGLRKQMTVAKVLAGTPAYGLVETGDVITHINDRKVVSGKRGYSGAIEYIFDENEDYKPIKLSIERGEPPEKIIAIVKPQKVCGGFIDIFPSSEVNAFADGEKIVFYTGMMREFVSDEELALVIGHELAHNTRLHIETGSVNILIGGLIGLGATLSTGIDFVGAGQSAGAAAFSESKEFEADYVGVYHVARAGYEIEKAPYFWRRSAARNPMAIDIEHSSHPNYAMRFLALEKAVAEIKDKQARGLPLIPEEQNAPVVGADQSEFNQ